MELLVFSSAGAAEPPEEYRFEDPERIVLGRGPQSPVPLDGPAVSREHLSVELRGGAVWVTDISSNGSYFNNRTLTPGAPQMAGPADEIRVGEYVLRFQIVAEEPPPTPADATASESTPANSNPARNPAPKPPPSTAMSFLADIGFSEWLALAVLLAAGALVAVWWLR